MDFITIATNYNTLLNTKKIREKTSKSQIVLQIWCYENIISIRLHEVKTIIIFDLKKVCKTKLIGWKI